MAVTLRPVTYYAYEADHPILSGIAGVGRTPQQALAAIRAQVRNRFPYSKFDIEETVLDAAGRDIASFETVQECQSPEHPIGPHTHRVKP